MPGREDWLHVAESDDAELRERILTGYKSGKPFTPYVPTISLPSLIGAVLDFGCGVGRNFPYLKTIATRVEGFDLPPMIERCRTLATAKVDRLSADWDEVKIRRYDLIFASLVLQHIETEDCRTYLADFARMAPAVYLLTRARNDFDVRVLQLVGESEVYEAGACAVVDHDPLTHQLRVAGALDFDAARRAPDDVHYEVLLRSVRFRR